MENGKKVCNELKKVRKHIADANGIEYNPTECTHKGDCTGTCPACEAEVKYIERELNVRRMIGKAAIVAGLGLSVASCVAGGLVRGKMAGDAPPVDTCEVLIGEVAVEVDSMPVTDTIIDNTQ